jgi:hypothetical protein
MQQRVIEPTAQDYQTLLNGNFQAATELKAIVLARLLAEKEAELQDLQEAGGGEVVPIREAASEK